MEKLNVAEREQRGMDNFKRGYNCAQSVVLAFADVYGLSDEMALRVAASFGAGIGRMRLTCGGANGMFLLAGLENGSVIAGDLKGRGDNYQFVQELAARFKQEAGSLICAELLGLKPGLKEGTMPGERTAEYYRKRPCVGMVGLGCRIYAEMLNERHGYAENDSNNLSK